MVERIVHDRDHAALPRMVAPIVLHFERDTVAFAPCRLGSCVDRLMCELKSRFPEITVRARSIITHVIDMIASCGLKPAVEIQCDRSNNHRARDTSSNSKNFLVMQVPSPTDAPSGLFWDN